MARLNVNQLQFDDEVAGTKKIKRVRKFKEDNFDGDSDMRKQYKRKK